MRLLKILTPTAWGIILGVLILLALIGFGYSKPFPHDPGSAVHDEKLRHGAGRWFDYVDAYGKTKPETALRGVTIRYGFFPDWPKHLRYTAVAYKAEKKYVGLAATKDEARNQLAKALQDDDWVGKPDRRVELGTEVVK